VVIGVQGLGFTNIVIAPGQETSILMKVTADVRPNGKQRIGRNAGAISHLERKVGKRKHR
ncbi:MAG: hypothetical protein IIT40_05170, partial [Prevotella sp.]|nr:hypothetical protein [Prevotella sp.]